MISVCSWRALNICPQPVRDSIATTYDLLIVEVEGTHGAICEPTAKHIPVLSHTGQVQQLAARHQMQLVNTPVPISVLTSYHEHVTAVRLDDYQ